MRNKVRERNHYSPANQDEYQRLWHQASAERDRLAANLEQLRLELVRVDKERADLAARVAELDAADTSHDSASSALVASSSWASSA